MFKLYFCCVATSPFVCLWRRCVYLLVRFFWHKPLLVWKCLVQFRHKLGRKISWCRLKISTGVVLTHVESPCLNGGLWLDSCLTSLSLHHHPLHLPDGNQQAEMWMWCDSQTARMQLSVYYGGFQFLSSRQSYECVSLGLGTETSSVRVRKTSCFSFKYLIWSSETQLETCCQKISSFWSLHTRLKILSSFTKGEI